MEVFMHLKARFFSVALAPLTLGASAERFVGHLMASRLVRKIRKKMFWLPKALRGWKKVAISTSCGK